MATRFGPGAQQFPSPQSGSMRPGYMRLASSNGPTNGPPNGTSYGHPQRQPSGGGGGSGAPPMRKPDRKDAKEVAWVHWRALKDFLTAFGDKGAFHGARAQCTMSRADADARIANGARKRARKAHAPDAPPILGA